MVMVMESWSWRCLRYGNIKDVVGGGVMENVEAGSVKGGVDLLLLQRI